MLGLRKADGHWAGADKTEEMLDWAKDLGIQHITLYSFSTENFQRTREELDSLFSLFKDRFTRVLDDERVRRYRIRVQIIGDRSLIPPDLLDVIEKAEKATRHYHNHFLNVALAYGGRNEIVLAARDILEKVRNNQCNPQSIDNSI
jgi:tritrans,polycis-undecaprenyl-diphosphate synthase [geranylgeranyl-diphosphate specific]